MISQTRTEVVVPEGVVRARTAFLKDFPSLWADPKTRGRYVCYHNDARVAASEDYLALVREVAARNIPEDASLIAQVTPASEQDERAIAEEAELP